MPEGGVSDYEAAVDVLAGLVEWWDQLEMFDSPDPAYSLIAGTDQNILEDLADNARTALACLREKAGGR